MSHGANGNGGPVTGKLLEAFKSLAGAAEDAAKSAVKDKLTQYAGGGGGPGQAAVAKGMEALQQGESPAKAALGAGMTGGKEGVKQTFGKLGGGGGSGGKNSLKVTNIVESIEVGVPVSVAYNQWTEFKSFPSFMKKVEDIDQESSEKMKWKAQVFWSHRTWESTITEQVPDERIVWTSKGEKGSVDGTVTFHEVAQDLTRILVVLEYHPQGFMEGTGNLWRAPGRRARLELKHFVRHVMRETILNPDDVHGWRGEIRDGEVVQEDERSGDEGDDSGQQEEPKSQREEDKADEGAKDGEADRTEEEKQSAGASG
ncbi:putative membrane protein [Asanoa ferruginea]|uniref:Putative membrane protein n=1 Tax=Asanoa ferruginea TaxID=53367 RepID=A0A3D9ZWW6_9ACTN|nr:putative membrane protein [Asanoa ferruginea]